MSTLRPGAARRLLRRAAAPGPDGLIVGIDPASAGWDYTTCHVYRLRPGQSVDRPADDQERLVLVLEGYATVRAGDHDFGVVGSRTTVFDGPSAPVILLEPGLPVELTATTDALVRQIPGRLVGMTRDLDGQRAFVMTMRAREQDIRRDKAASNICTNQALLALAASIYLATIGPHGLRDVAATGAARAAELEAALAAVGVPRLHPGAYLNEFAIAIPHARVVHRRLLDHGFLAGLALVDAEPHDPSLADALLVCATEVTTSDEIARFARAIAQTIDDVGGRPAVAVEAGAGATR